MKITDYAYITRMRDVVFRPALMAMEAAMLPAQLPCALGALRHVRLREAEHWNAICRKSESGRHGPGR